MSPKSPLTFLSNQLAAYRRHWRRCTLGAAIGAAVVLGGFALLPTQYRARYVLDANINSQTPQAATAFVSDPQMIKSAITQLQPSLSPVHVRARVKDEKLQLVLRVTDTSDHNASLLLEQAGTLINAEAMNMQQATLAAQLATHEQQAKAAREQLTKLADQRSALQEQHPNLTDQSIDKAAESLTQSRELLKQLEAKLARLTDESHSQLRQHKTLSDLQAQLANLERDLAVHKDRWGRGDDHPLVRKTYGQISKIKSDITQAKVALLDKQSDPHHQQIVKELKETRSIIESTKSRITEEEAALVHSKTLHDLNTKIAQVAAALRTADIAIAAIQSRLADKTNIVTITQRTPSLAPVIAPTTKHIAGVTGFIAVFLFFSIGTLLARSDRTILSMDQAVSHLRIPVLGSVDRFTGDQDTTDTPLRKAA